MNTVLIDADVVSFLFKGDSRANEYAPWAEVRAYRRSVGRPVSAQDAWIAAAALRYQIPLITHNAKDFEKIETLKIITSVS
jgi:predicted nucleic acid-binding protein